MPRQDPVDRVAASPVDLRRVEYFLAIVDRGGVGRAAEHLLVAQPSLSQAIKTLERELGARLFDRAGRRLELTEAGRALVAPARQLLRDVRAASEAAREVAELRGGWVGLIALQALAVDPLVELASRFRRRYPDVGLNVLAPAHPADVDERVRSGDCEFGLTLLHREDSELVVHELSTQRFDVVLPPATSEPDDASALTLAALTDLPWVMTPPGSSTRELLDQAVGAVGGEIAVAVETDEREAVLPLVLAGAGATILPAPLAALAGRRGARVRPVDPPLTWRVSLVHRSGSLSAPAEAFLAVATGKPAPARDPPGQSSGT